MSDTVQRRHTVALFVSPKLNSCGVNMFLRPSYAPRGVNMAGAITSCSRLMISKFILTGRVSDDMTTAAYNGREREAILDKERYTIIVVYYTRGNVDGVMVGRDSDLPAGSPWSRAPYTNRLNMPCRHMCSSCYCACGWTPTPRSRRTGRCTASTSSCAGWHDGCLRRGECRRLREARSRGTYRLYISRRMEQSRMREVCGGIQSDKGLTGSNVLLRGTLIISPISARTPLNMSTQFPTHVFLGVLRQAVFATSSTPW